MCPIIRSVDLRFKHNLPLLKHYSHIIVNNKNVSNVAGGDGRKVTVEEEEEPVGLVCRSGICKIFLSYSSFVSVPKNAVPGGQDWPKGFGDFLVVFVRKEKLEAPVI